MPTERLLNMFGMELNERIKFARTSAGLTQAELARVCKVSRAAVNGWESGSVKNLRNAHLFAVSKATGYSPEWLATERGPELATASTGMKDADSSDVQWLGQLDAWDSDTPLHEDEVELSLFREVEMAAGNGRTEVIENHGAKLRFARSTLRRAGVEPENAACAVLKGNSGEPVLPDGATVGIDTGDKSIRDGEIYALDHDGLLRVKQMYRLPGSKIRLRSFNRDEHPDEEYSPDETVENIRIIGRVFWWSVLR